MVMASNAADRVISRSDIERGAGRTFREGTDRKKHDQKTVQLNL